MACRRENSHFSTLKGISTFRLYKYTNTMSFKLQSLRVNLLLIFSPSLSSWLNPTQISVSAKGSHRSSRIQNCVWVRKTRKLNLLIPWKVFTCLLMTPRILIFFALKLFASLKWDADTEKCEFCVSWSGGYSKDRN